MGQHRAVVVVLGAVALSEEGRWALMSWLEDASKGGEARSGHSQSEAQWPPVRKGDALSAVQSNTWHNVYIIKQL